MIRWLVLWAINTFAMMALPYFFKDLHVSNWTTALLAAVVLGFLNSIIKPILQILTLPLMVITLGLFTWVINALFMILLGKLIPGFTVDGFWTAMFASMVYSLISWAGATILLPSKKDAR